MNKYQSQPVLNLAFETPNTFTKLNYAAFATEFDCGVNDSSIPRRIKIHTHYSIVRLVITIFDECS